MIKVPVLTTLLLQLLHILSEVSGQSSPCPQYFEYRTDPFTNEVRGYIQIPYPPRGIQLNLRVGLSIGVGLPSRYVGQIELTQSKEDSVRAVEAGRPLTYNVRFPLSRPIPLLTGIWFNNQLYCSGPRATGETVTSIVLQHTLYPPNSLPLSPTSNPTIRPPQSSGGSFPGPFVPEPTRPPIFTIPTYQTIPPYWTIPTLATRPPATRPPATRPPATPPPATRPPATPPPVIRPPVTRVPPNTQVSTGSVFSNSNCGRSAVRSNNLNARNNNINLLIAKGMNTLRGEWPWLVAIFLATLPEFEYHCAGSLLTTRHVITAAHCFKREDQRNSNLPASALLVALGRYRLRDWQERGSETREVESFTIHPDYTHEASGDSDLAILVVRRPVQFSITIRPLCLWTGPSSLQSVITQKGVVVGWGRDENGQRHLAEPRMVKVPIVSQRDCLSSDVSLINFTSNRTLCAGMRDGSGPCNGDSGSGLVLYDAARQRYQLRGIVSRSVLDYAGMTCDLTQYVVYVDVAKYLDWIYQQTTTT